MRHLLSSDMSTTFSGLDCIIGKDMVATFSAKKMIGRKSTACINQQRENRKFSCYDVMERKSLTEGGNICKVFQPKLSNSEFLDVNECYRTSGFVTCPARNPFVYAAFLKRICKTKDVVLAPWLEQPFAHADNHMRNVQASALASPLQF